MFNSISWHEFINGALLIVFSYYTVVAVVFYKTEFLELLGIQVLTKGKDGSITLSQFSNESTQLQQASNKPQPSSEISILHYMPSLQNELTAYLEEVAGTNMNKHDLLSAIKTITQKYPLPTDNDSKKNIQQSILQKVNIQFPGELSNEDIAAIWN
jgi:hypothetical protein